MTKEEVIQEILLVCKAGNVCSIDEVLLALSFKTLSELVSIATELNIKTTNLPL